VDAFRYSEPESGWQLTFNRIDEDIVRESACPACGGRDLLYRGFRRDRQHKSLSSCQECHVEIEF
jgi:hypothetical protein